MESRNDLCRMCNLACPDDFVLHHADCVGAFRQSDSGQLFARHQQKQVLYVVTCTAWHKLCFIYTVSWSCCASLSQLLTGL